MFEALLTDRKNLSTSGNIPFTLCNHSFDITQGIFPQREANSILVGGMQEPLTPTGFPIQSARLLPATFPASVTDSSLDPVTGEAMSGVYKALTAFATDPNFTDRMNVPFGENWDKEKAKALKEEWLNGNFSNIPLIKVVSSGDIGGANGAFGTATNTIYLSKEFLVQNATRLDALTGVLLEEVGHFIDSEVNHLDSPGDEGEIFAAVVQGKNLSQEKLQLLKAEDDRAMVLIEGKEISIEQVANTVTVSAIDANAAEVISGQTLNPGMYRISRTDSTTAPLTVPYTMSGTGSNGSDYTSLNGTATIPAGQTFVDVPLNVIDDTWIESNETAILTVSSSTNYTLGATNTAIVTIADNDQNTVTVSAIDASAAEVISGQTLNPGMYRMSRTGSTNSALTVPYTLSGTGSNGSDYTSLNGTATIPAGQTFVDVPLNVIDDTWIESNETAILTVSSSTNYTLGATNTAIVTIADNDQNTVTVSAIDASAAEVISGQTLNPGMYRMSRTGSTNSALTVPYTLSGTGSNGSDYTSLNGTATIPAGQTFVDVPLNVIDDTWIESNETAILTVSSSTNYTLGATNTAIVTIADNDQNTVTVSAIDASAAEVISGQTLNPGMYRMSRTGSTNSALIVPYTLSGTGSNGSDYTSLNGTATIPAGQTFVDVPLNVIDDTWIESNETAILTVSSSTNYTLGATNTAIVTIADNDQNTVTVSAIDASAAEVISGQTLNPGMYRMSRTGSTNSALTVPYTLSGTGSNGSDYTSLNGTATIPAGQTFVDVPLNVIDDTLIESSETAILTVSSSSNYTVGATNTATVTIADNDPIVPPDYAGNTPSAARQVTVGSTSNTWSDWVGTQDTNDYYKFTLANSSNFNLSLNGLSSDADVHLLDSTGNTVLQSSALSGTSAESISTMLNAGAYYVRVYPYNGSTNYNLSMSAVPNLSTVTVSAIDASAAEVISGQAQNPGMYRMSRTGNTTSALTVPYTMSGTSLNGSDYTFLNGTATIPAGQTFVDVPLNVINDTLIESNETAILTVSSSSNYTVGASNTATVTIADNDQNTVTVSAIDASAAEVISGQAQNPGMYRMSRTGSTISALTVPYTMSGTSLNGTDYTFLNGTATIPAGQTFVDVPLNVINDTLIESNETAILTVSSSSNYTVGASNTATVTIADNDQNTVTVSAIDASAAEVISGQAQNPGMYRMSRTGSTISALTVPYTMSGTSLNGTDYTFLNGTATIPAGQTFVDVPLNVINDTLIESNETAILTVSSSSNYTVGASNTATVTIADNDLADWFDLNIQDLGLRSTARVAASDSVINRNEMISILQNAQDGNVIDSTELTNLRNLLTSNTRPFSIPHYVQNLTNKVVNSELANQTYQGNALGNLSANSSATQMDKLINKWFLGLDRPSTSYTYQYASGSLFQNGVSYQDIAQGAVGDCYYLASLAATAFRSPSTIQNMFVDNGDNTYTVRFYKNGVADYVTVDRYLPTTSWGSLPYAKTPNSELWVALAEKAYAQVNQSGWLQQDGTNSYLGIEGGLGYYSIPHVTGRNTAYIYTPSGLVDTNAIKNAFNAGQMVTVGSKPSGVASNVVASHEYTLVGYNSSTQQFSLYNPHGVNSTPNSGHLNVTASQLLQSFNYWAYTTENGMPQYGSSTTLPPELFS